MSIPSVPFIVGPDSGARFDQIVGYIEQDNEVLVSLISGERVLLRISLDEFWSAMEEARKIW